MLLNNAGAGIKATVNEAAPGNDAAFAFKSGFSARALIGLLGDDDFRVKGTPDGATFHDALQVDRSSGRVELPKPAVLPGFAAAPSPPVSGKIAVYAHNRAGVPWLDVMRPTGRDLPLQAHLGVNRVATWSPFSSTTVNAEGMLLTSVGTVSTPGLELCMILGDAS